MKIESVEIHNMHKVDTATYDFSDVNYISGENGAGKSTILEAIQLAVLGYIPGYNKRNADIMKHSNADTMSVKVTFDTGDYIQRKYSQKYSKSVTCDVDSSFGNEFDVVQELELPIYNFSSFLDMSPNEQKKWFISYLPKEDNDLDWEEILKPEVENLPEYDDDTYEEIVQGIYERKLTDVNDVYEYMKSMVSFVNGQIKAKNSVLSDMAYYEDIKDSDEDDIKQQISIRNKELADNRSVLDNYQKYDDLKKEIDFYKSNLKADTKEDDSEYIELKSRIDTIDSDITGIEAEIDVNLEKESALVTQISNASAEVSKYRDVIDMNDICPIISDIHCDKLADYKDSCKDKYDKAVETLVDLQKQNEEIDSILDELHKEKTGLEHDKSEANNRLLRIDMNYELYSDRVNTFNTLFPNANEGDLDRDELQQKIDFLVSEIAKLQDTLSQIYANKKYDELKSTNEVALSRYENELVILKRLQEFTGPNELQQELLAKPFKNLQNDITEYLKQMFNSEDVSCYMNLSSKSNSFEFGLVRDNKEVPFTVLSSGEKCMYMLALQSSIISRNPLGLATLMVDDVFDHLDEENIKFLVEAIMNTDIQYIIAGVAVIPEIDKFKDLNRIEL